MKLSTAKVQKIAIFRALQLGDILCAIPALRSLRKAYPEATVTYIGLPATESLIRRFPHYFDQFIPFPGYPGLPEQPFHAADFKNFENRVRREKFDLILQMQGNGTIVNDMIGCLGATYMAGFCPHSGEENALLLTYPNFGHELTRHLALMRHLGIPADDPGMEFPIYEADRSDLERLELPIQYKRYVCVHPGSRGNWRQWPPLYFAALADFCYQRGHPVVLTGTQEELPLVNHVADLMKSTPIISAGKTSLGAMAALISQSFALIANCTGVSHISVALGVQSVIISMDGEPERWTPMNKELHRSVDWTTNSDYNDVLRELTGLYFRL